jgi:hypothetical protein
MTLMAPIVYAVVPDALARRRPDLLALPDRDTPYRNDVDWFLKPWRESYAASGGGPERFARETLSDLPENAILVAHSTVMPPVPYLQSSEGLRRDVRIVNAGQYQPWFSGGFDLDSPDRGRAIGAGRLFTISNQREYLNALIRGDEYDYVSVGRVFRVVWSGGAVRTGTLE